MNGKRRDILLGVVIGDALGTALDGLGRGHIRARIGEFAGYPDPAPALKGAMERWRKPGLYSSISQFAMILAMAPSRPGSRTETFAAAVASSPGLPGNDAGIFRHADAAERRFVARMKGRGEDVTVPFHPSARVIAAAAALCTGDRALSELAADTLSYVRLFTRDVTTAAVALLLAFLLERLFPAGTAPGELITAADDAAADLSALISADPASIFACGMNPDHLDRALLDLRETFSRMAAAGEPHAAEKAICVIVNRRMKTPITRATVNDPGAVLPYALALAAHHPDPPSLLFRAVSEGGNAAALGSLCGSLLAASSDGPALPETLVRDLVNRKRIISLIQSIPVRAGNREMISDFLSSEGALTDKETEELRARTRHGKKTTPRKPDRADRENRLSRHAVESWTRLDRARWRKDRKRDGEPDGP